LKENSHNPPFSYFEEDLEDLSFNTVNVNTNIKEKIKIPLALSEKHAKYNCSCVYRPNTKDENGGINVYNVFADSSSNFNGSASEYSISSDDY
jgi:hypothetical protein